MSDRRSRRKADLRERLRSTRPDGRQYCWVFGCKAAPGNVSGRGLGRFCRSHLEHYRRHGDPLKGSYRAEQIKPFRTAAAAWIARNKADRYVAAALEGMAGLMRSAGVAIEPRNLRGVSAAGRARSVWARLRDRGVEPEKVLSAVLGVAMVYSVDRQRAKLEHRRVQIGKRLTRMGGGIVRVWPSPHNASGTLKLQWFPASEGRVLRLLGKDAERAAEFLIDDRMSELLDFAAGHRQRAIVRSLPFT